MARSIVQKKIETGASRPQKNILLDQTTNKKVVNVNRFMLLFNFIKEAGLVILFFLIVSSQLKTSKALSLREELAIRFDLEAPDYMYDSTTGFDRVNSFNSFYTWMNSTFLPRIFMDPFYKNLEPRSPNWAAPLKGSNVGMIMEGDYKG